jgi:hypothetical protein
MVKYLFIAANALAVFFFSLFSGDDGVRLSSNVPTSIFAEKETVVEIIISKGTQSGFAKLQIDVPEGITVKNSDGRGGAFSFSAGVAKWVWASLPAETEFTVKLIVLAEKSFLGRKKMNAKYSFVKDNKKEVIEMPTAEFTVKEPEVIVENVGAANANSTTAGTATTALNGGDEPNGAVGVKRTVVKNSAKEFLIKLEIKKDGTKGFARYSDDIPANASAKAVLTDGGSFSVADGKIKFVWVAVPAKDVMEISYVLSSKEAQRISLKGEYSYLEFNQSKKFTLKSEGVEFTEDTFIAATPTLTANPTNSVSANTNTVTNTNTMVAVTTPTKSDSGKNENKNESENAVAVNSNTVALNSNTIANNNNNNNNDKNNASASNGNTISSVAPEKFITGGNTSAILFKVQIGAFKTASVTALVLKKQFDISETINSEMQNGFTKFMIGNHPQYELARNQREKISTTNKITTAFVVAYNGPTRITVQEALLASNQKWLK